MLGKFASGMKDGALGVALRAFLNEKLSAYGDINDCKVDTRRQRISARARLKGETEDVVVTIDRYELDQEGEKLFATIRQVSASRPWMSLLLSRLFTGKRYKLPSAVRNIL